jgi:hypothetical protein
MASTLPYRALVPRYCAPAVLDHLKRAGAPFATGTASYKTHTLEVFTTLAGVEVLEKHGIAGAPSKRRNPWDAMRIEPGGGRQAFFAARQVPRDDPLEVAYRTAEARLKAMKEGKL